IACNEDNQPRSNNDASKNDPRIFEPAVHGREQRAGTRKSDWDLYLPRHIELSMRGEGSFPAAMGGWGRSCRRARLQLDTHCRERDEDPRLRASLVADGVAHEAELLDRTKWVEKIASRVEIIEVIGRMISVDVALAHRRIGVVT